MFSFDAIKVSQVKFSRKNDDFRNENFRLVSINVKIEKKKIFKYHVFLLTKDQKSQPTKNLGS